jgi:tyrosyl-tRNA synthetase
MLVGRGLLKSLKNKEKIVITTQLLEGTDGRKMSKTFGNTININLDSKEMYVKILSIKNELIGKYFRFVTDVSLEEVEKLEKQLAANEADPLAVKRQLAFEIVKSIYGDVKAKKAGQEVQPGVIATPTVYELKDSKLMIKDLLVDAGSLPTVSAATQIIKQGGVEIDNKKISDPFEVVDFKDNDLIKVGKKKAILVKRR